MLRLQLRRCLSCLALLSLLLLAAGGPKEIKPGWNLFSREQDVQLGREAALQMERQLRLVRDPQLTAYIQRIGQRLASTPEAGGYPYSFKIADDQAVNAFALPGGPVYVFTGLIRTAENESQLAGVLAHEISHVALRHGTSQASKANLVQLPALLAGSIVGADGSLLGRLAQLGIGLGANSVLLKFSRTAEDQADRLGARMMARARYNPIEMARFFEKLESQAGPRLQFFSDHPNPGNRMRAIQEEIRWMPPQEFNAETGQFRQIQARLAQLR